MSNRDSGFTEPSSLGELIQLINENPSAVETALQNSPAISNKNYSDRLFRWLSTNSSSISAKHISGVIGYNDTPLFGATKKKARLISHILILNTAIVIHAANKTLTQDKLKPVIDGFLALALVHCFRPVEAHHKTFAQDYTDGLTFYLDRLKVDASPLELANYFCQKLKKDTDIAVTYIAATIFRLINELEGNLLVWSSVYNHLKSSEDGAIQPSPNIDVIVNRYEIEKHYPGGSLGLAKNLRFKGRLNNDFLVWESKESANTIVEVTRTLDAAGLNCDNEDPDCVYTCSEGGSAPRNNRSWIKSKPISSSRCEVWKI